MAESVQNQDGTIQAHGWGWPPCLSPFASQELTPLNEDNDEWLPSYFIWLSRKMMCVNNALENEKLHKNKSYLIEPYVIQESRRDSFCLLIRKSSQKTQWYI